MNKKIWNYIRLCDLQASYLLYVFALIILSITELLSVGIIFPILATLMKEEVDISSYDFEFIHWLISLNQETILISAIILYILRAFFSIICSWYQAKFAQEAIVRLSEKVFNNYLNSSVDYIEAQKTSDIIRKVTGTISQVVNSYIIQMTVVLFELITLSLLVLLVFSLIGTELFIGIVFILFFLALLTKAISKVLQRLGSNKRLAEGSRIEYVHELTGMFREITYLNIASFLKNDFNLASKKSGNASVIQMTLSVIPRNILELTIFCGCLGFLLILSAKDGDLIKYIPTTGTIMFALLRLAPSINKINQGWQNYHFSTSFINELDIELDDSRFVNLEKNKNSNAKINFSSLTVSNLKVQRSENILGPWSLELNKGEWLSIEGTTGVGKSTLMDAIMGFALIKSGDILLNNKSILSQHNSFYNIVGFVPQSVHLLNRSLKENIVLYSNDISDEEYRKVLSICCLGDLDFRIDLKGQTTLDNSGISGGQRQRVGIARALITNPKILFLDESTAGLDAKIQEEVLLNIRQEYPSLSVLMITHSEHASGFCDRKITLK